jgi:hypothetical protein
MGDDGRLLDAGNQALRLSRSEFWATLDDFPPNVTAFMTYAPQVRSTRSFSLQYRDDQWKICESSTN